MLAPAGYCIAAINPRDVVWISIASGVLLIGVLLAFILVRKFFAASRPTKQDLDPVFTLAQLRELHDQGQLSDEEYQKLKDKMLGSARSGNLIRPD